MELMIYNFNFFCDFDLEFLTGYEVVNSDFTFVNDIVDGINNDTCTVQYSAQVLFQSFCK